MKWMAMMLPSVQKIARQQKKEALLKTAHKREVSSSVV
jgi:hypothetical protein